MLFKKNKSIERMQRKLAKEVEKQRIEREMDAQHKESISEINKLLMEGTYASAVKIGEHLEMFYFQYGDAGRKSYRALAARRDAPCKKSKLNNCHRIYKQDGWLEANKINIKKYNYSILVRVLSLPDNDEKLTVLNEIAEKEMKTLDVEDYLKARKNKSSQEITLADEYLPQFGELGKLFAKYQKFNFSNVHQLDTSFSSDQILELKTVVDEIITKIGPVKNSYEMLGVVLATRVDNKGGEVESQAA